MDLGLKGLKAIVTGSTKGIGRRCADLFADEGADVGICARNAAEVEETVAALRAKGVAAFGQAIDVADKGALENWVAACAAALGGIDMVVANVSALAVSDDEEAWRKQVDTDMMHTVNAVAVRGIESLPAIVIPGIVTRIGTWSETGVDDCTIASARVSSEATSIATVRAEVTKMRAAVLPEFFPNQPVSCERRRGRLRGRSSARMTVRGLPSISKRLNARIAPSAAA